MNECYTAALSANLTTIISMLIGVIIGWFLWDIVSLIVERWKIRRDRKRLDQVMADTGAQREQQRTPTNP